jgi:hypothetical protein
MPVAAVMEFKNATLEQYDEVISRMGLQPGSPGPEGALFHWVAATGDGLLVTDVWQTAEQFQQFADTQIGPITQEVGIEGPPAVTMHEVHSYLIGP